MLYPTYIISDKGELARCPVFTLEHYMWNSLRRPETFGRMGYIMGRGLFVRMTCVEREPKRACTRHGEMICNDSAMEVFLAFPDANLAGGPPTSESLYFNFEVNANGAMYAKYGYGRKDRRFITDDEYAETGVTARVEPESWTMELLVPDSLLKRVGGIADFAPGSVFYCNFYKIAEDSAIEHYGAYVPTKSDTPNFHLPQFFARAEVRGGGAL